MRQNGTIKNQNPLNYVSLEELKELGLSESDIADAYQPSSGGVYHARGAESTGKTLWVAHKYRHLVDIGLFTPYDAVGNLSFKGKYGDGFTTLKGDDLRQYLWDLTHKPLKHKIVIIDEADSEFPARFFPDKEQTEIALRMWHTAKLGNWIFLTSHIGNSTDLIFHLATHYFIYPEMPNFLTNTLGYTVVNILDQDIQEDWETDDIIKTMLIYSRQELTENTEIEQNKARPKPKSQTTRKQDSNLALDGVELDIEREMREASFLG